MKDTPQGRPVFFCDINGVQVGWQARILTQMVGDAELVWHPYKNAWVTIRAFDGKDWAMSPGFETANGLSWKDHAKYKTSPGASRNQILMGVDHAVAWNAEHRPGLAPIAVLAEGPLDAARLPMGVATLGKHLSEAQAEVLRKKFQRFIYVPDNDESGRKALRRVRQVLASSTLHVAELPKGFKDIGAMTYEQAELLVKPYIQ
jgi:hypothetical protein